MTQMTAASPLGRRFLIVWVGQTASEIGSTVSGVGVGIFVFLETGSAAWLGVFSAFVTLPYLLAAPFVSIIDRRPRRQVMIWADVFAAVGPAVALLLAVVGTLEVWHLAVASLLGGFGTAFQVPASQAAVPALVTAEALDRANALKQMGPAIGIVFGPLLAAPVVAWFGIEALLIIDLATFLVGVAAVLIVRFPDHRDGSAVPDDGSWTMMWAWLSTDGRALLRLMLISSVVNFAFAVFNVSVVALATTVAGVSRAGLVLGAGGAAMVVGSLVHSQRPSQPDRVGVFARSLVIMSGGLVVTSARPATVVVLLGVVIALGAVPAANAAATTIYNERVPASMQGRVFALRGLLSQLLQPLGALVAGFGISYGAAPLISEGGAISESLGRVIGSGADRAPAVALLLCASLLAAIGLWLSGSPLRDALRQPTLTRELGESDVVKTETLSEPDDSESVRHGRVGEI